jgi:pimeloyl-ACP methyl ester carboxylesterase
MTLPGPARAPALVIAGLLVITPAAAGMLGDLSFEPCVLTTVGLPRPIEAQCTTVAVPEDPSVPDGRQIDLALAWVPVEGEAEPDPVIFIAGGPGQSAREQYPALAPAFGDIRRSRHILLLDQRGTGGSRPLFCPEDEDVTAVLGSEDAAPAQLREFAERCRDELQEIADLRFYTTTEAVHDLEFVRRRIGAPQLNLIGVSYGTRVAQQYAKTHPDGVRTIILDSVLPADLALGAEHARNLQDALDAQFARCRATPACRAAFGDPAPRLEVVVQRLRAGDLAPVRYRDPSSGEWREEVPAFAHLAGVLRLYSYTPLTASLLPLILHQADAGDYTALLAMARMIARDLGGQMATGMHNSVVCTEDADGLQQQGEAHGTLLGEAFVASLQAQCAAWPRGTLPEDLHRPLTGGMPVLLISGEYDPVTPPRYGDRVAAHLRHARHLVLKGQGHSLFSTGCMPKLAAQFIERADALDLDASCLERVAPPPPFSGLYGWEP